MTETGTALTLSGSLTVLVGLVATAYLASTGGLWSWLATTTTLVAVGVAFLIGGRLFRSPDQCSHVG